MNFTLAKEILQLPDDFNQDTVRQNYRQLVLKYHPDKGGDNEQFVKITQAYDFLNKKHGLKEENYLNLNDIFRTFVNTGVSNFFKKPSFFGFKKEVKITLSPQEFLEGFTRQVETLNKTHCGCEQKFCDRCRGFSFNNCTQCSGAGIVQQCEKCVNGIITTKKIIDITIPKTSLKPIIADNLIINLELNKSDKHYFVKNDKLYYRFKISLKESLTGFKKKFKDPFGIEYPVISESIIKPNDGYFIKENLYLLFEIVYPKKLLTQLKMIDF
jgi:DnaJ-class molecular chaperone